MTRKVLATALASLLAGVLVASAAQAPASGKRAPGRYEMPAPLVADTVVLARVDDKVIRVRDYVERFFNSALEFRSSQDSLGRVEFLKRLIDKEVVAKVAHAAGYQETFEQRTAMRNYTRRVLGNILFEREVRDSVRISDAEAESVYAQMKRELRLARVRFGSLESATRIRRDLLAGRLSWARAWDLRLRIPGDASTSSDIGWHTRQNAPPEVATAVFGLPIGAISGPVAEPPGFSLYRVQEERPARLQEFRMVRGIIVDNLRAAKTALYRERLMAGVREKMALRFDSVNVAWAARRFPTKVAGEGTSKVVLDVSVPTFSPEDTGRVIATYRGGTVTLGRLVDAYRETPDLMRPSLDTEEAFRAVADVIVLEPVLADLARERGYDRDSAAVTLIERKREEDLVERLYRDSIEARVFVPPAERRKYYKENQHRFVTSPTARYAAFYLPDKASMESVTSRLRRGIRAEEVIRADSIAGTPRGQIFTRQRDDLDNPFYAKVFFNMKVGEVATIGPDAVDGSYNVVQLLYLDSGTPVPFEEADRQIDEFLQQAASEKLLAAFVERHKRGMKIESHPELLMRIRLVPPN